MPPLTRAVEVACERAVDKSRYIAGPHAGKAQFTGVDAEFYKYWWMRVDLRPKDAGRKAWVSRAVCVAALQQTHTTCQTAHQKGYGLSVLEKNRNLKISMEFIYDRRGW